MTETATADPEPDRLAGVVADASFVRLVATDDGDALAAAALLARALRAVDAPFHVRVARDPTRDIAEDPADGSEKPENRDVTVVLGTDVGTHAVPGAGRPASTTAYAVARELCGEVDTVDTDIAGEPDPVLALAGTVAAGSVPGTDGSGDALSAAEAAELVRRRPGVAVPTADVARGLASSTLLRAPYSGDPEATRAAVAALDLPAELDDDAHRRLASLVAVDVAGAESASERSASAVERALRPYALAGDGRSTTPVETVGGYADVLDGLARAAPGTGIALALATDPSDDLRTAALDAWHEHGLTAHRALDAATTGRYDGCVVARVDAPAATLPTIARLVRDFRSPEPVAIAVDEAAGELAAAAVEPIGLGDVCRSVAVEFDGTGWGTATRGGVAVADGMTTEALAALREAL